MNVEGPTGRAVVVEDPAAVRGTRSAREWFEKARKRTLNHGSDLIVVDRACPAWPRLVQQALDALLQEPPPPFARGMFVHAQLDCDDLAGQAIATSQDDPAPFRHRSCHTTSAYLPFEIITSVILSINGARARIRHDCVLQS
jgi:hypothetical protein